MNYERVRRANEARVVVCIHELRFTTIPKRIIMLKCKKGLKVAATIYDKITILLTKLKNIFRIPK